MRTAPIFPSSHSPLGVLAPWRLGVECFSVSAPDGPLLLHAKTPSREDAKRSMTSRKYIETVHRVRPSCRLQPTPACRQFQLGVDKKPQLPAPWPYLFALQTAADLLGWDKCTDISHLPQKENCPGAKSETKSKKRPCQRVAKLGGPSAGRGGITYPRRGAGRAAGMGTGRHRSLQSARAGTPGRGRDRRAGLPEAGGYGRRPAGAVHRPYPGPDNQWSVDRDQLSVTRSRGGETEVGCGKDENCHPKIRCQLTGIRCQSCTRAEGERGKPRSCHPKTGRWKLGARWRRAANGKDVFLCFLCGLLFVLNVRYFPQVQAPWHQIPRAPL